MNNKTINPRETELDGAGIIYPYVANRSWNSVYRIEACLKQTVNADALKHAVDDLRRDYPYFFMTLAKTRTKFVLRECTHAINTVYNNCTEVCKPFDLKSGEPLIRFIYSGNKIILEMFHSLTDGHGATELMKMLLLKYRETFAAESSVKTDSVGKGSPLLQNQNDIFERLFSEGGKNVSRLISSAYQIKRLCPTHLQYETLEIPCDQLINAAHFYGVSVAVLVCALQIKAIAVSQKNITKVIRISVPVDLRRLFGDTSCRNSSLYFLVSAKVEEAEIFTDLLEKVKRQFKRNVTDENMRNLAYTNVSSAKLKAFKILPVSVKKAILKFGYTHLGENQFTATMTDIGVIKSDERLGNLVESIYFVLGKQKTKPINIAVTTYGKTARLIISYDTDCSSFVDAMSCLIKKYVL